MEQHFELISVVKSWVLTYYNLVHILVANALKYSMDLHYVCQLKYLFPHIGVLNPTICGLFLSCLTLALLTWTVLLKKKQPFNLWIASTVFCWPCVLLLLTVSVTEMLFITDIRFDICLQFVSCVIWEISFFQWWSNRELKNNWHQILAHLLLSPERG